MDWTDWTPQMRANLMFVKNGDQVLLIRKKRGLGAGKINGPGGKIEPGESARDGAIRETQEEVGITALDPVAMGELHFQFTDGLGIHVTVFVATRFEGEAIETDEAIPLWTPADAIPLDEMWEDDRYWLPQMLGGERFEGFFEFDGDKMLSRKVRFL